MALQQKPEEFTLENYDGKKAYFERTKYHIIKLGGVKYAFPNISEQIELEGISKEGELEKMFPIFEIIDENLRTDQARAVNANHKKEELYELLKSISDYLGR